jgi:hypothetical protein
MIAVYEAKRIEGAEKFGPQSKKTSRTRLNSPFPPPVPLKVTVEVAPDAAAQQLEERRPHLIDEFLKAHAIK